MLQMYSLVVLYLAFFMFAKYIDSARILRVDLESCSGERTLNTEPGRCLNYEKLIKSEKERRDVLNKINSRRDKVAAGELRSLPPAENMLKLEWDLDLEMHAQNWADKCLSYSQSDVKDPCFVGKEYMGQNIATVYGEAPGLTASVLVDVWYMELLNMNASVVTYYRPSHILGLQHYDYFTQLVWAESRHVGCGAVKFKENKKDDNVTVYRLVCNFSPSGNILNQNVYIAGTSCSRCDIGYHCDFNYNSLCGHNYSTLKPMTIYNGINSLESTNANTIVGDRMQTNHLFGSSEKPVLENVSSDNLKTQFNVDYENNSTFDVLSQLLEYTRAPITISASPTCKEVLVVDQFIDLLKKRIDNDHVLKELLFPMKITLNDTTEADATVAGIINQLYSTTGHMTTKSPTESEFINSTLLVDLVEAVIFRNNDKSPASKVVDFLTQTLPDVNTVKVKAELGKVQPNVEFTGHFFFPEDDNEEIATFTTESYYDVPYVPISEIALELEELKRNKGTKDFLEDILDSDFVTESISKSDVSSVDEIKIKRNEITNRETGNLYASNNEAIIERDQIFDLIPDEGNTLRNINFKKKRINDNCNINHGSTTIVKYSALLKKIANDIKRFKLNYKYYCMSSSFLININLSCYILFIVIYCIN